MHAPFCQQVNVGQKDGPSFSMPKLVIGKAWYTQFTLLADNNIFLTKTVNNCRGSRRIRPTICE